MSTATVKLRLGAAGLAVATAAAVTPVIAQADPFALTPSLVPSTTVLTWGSAELDPQLLALINNTAAPTAAADPTAGPVVTLIQYLVNGIATGIAAIIQGTVTIAATITYVSLAFTGGVLTTIGNILPGPLGDLSSYFGTAATNVANDVAQRFNVGPYSTSTL
jgi:hypothetical protein